MLVKISLKVIKWEAFQIFYESLSEILLQLAQTVDFIKDYNVLFTYVMDCLEDLPKRWKPVIKSS